MYTFSTYLLTVSLVFRCHTTVRGIYRAVPVRFRPSNPLLSSVCHRFLASSCGISYVFPVRFALTSFRCHMVFTDFFCATPLRVSRSLPRTSYIMYPAFLTSALRYASVSSITSFFYAGFMRVCYTNVPLVMLRQRCLHVYDIRVSCVASASFFQ